MIATKLGRRMAPLAVMAFGLAGIAAAEASPTITFTDTLHGSSPILVQSTDLAGALSSSTINSTTGFPAGFATSDAIATLSLGNVSGIGTSLLDIALVETGTKQKTGGGEGVSDILQLLSFSQSGTVIGLEAIYTSNEGKQGLPNPGFSSHPSNPTFCSTTPVNEPLCPPGQPNSEFFKTGAVLSFTEAVILPNTTESTDVTLNVLSPLQRVPEPSTGSLLIAGVMALAVRRRPNRVAAV
jgi:hypothetical protein